MSENIQNKPISQEESEDFGNELDGKPSSGSTPDNLVFNDEANSYEIDVASTDKEYDHPDPYKTAVSNGADANSDYDEANSTALDHYQDDPNKITDEVGMHVDSGKILELSSEDEELARTPEDDRDDLDEEGYPKNDADKDTGDNLR